MSITENQQKMVQFLKEEFSKIKSMHHHELKYNKYKKKLIDKKLQNLYLRIETTLKIAPLDPEVLQAIHILQQEIKDYLS